MTSEEESEIRLQLLRTTNALACLVSYLTNELGVLATKDLMDKIYGTGKQLNNKD